jgi:hypothetical protein
MPKLKFQLKHYIKAVESIAEPMKLTVQVTATTGSIIRFELFESGQKVPRSIWVIHHSHDRRQEVWSKDDYRKAALNLSCTTEEFIDRIKSFV